MCWRVTGTGWEKHPYASPSLCVSLPTRPQCLAICVVAATRLGRADSKRSLGADRPAVRRGRQAASAQPGRALILRDSRDEAVC